MERNKGRKWRVTKEVNGTEREREMGQNRGRRYNGEERMNRRTYSRNKKTYCVEGMRLKE